MGKAAAQNLPDELEQFFRQLRSCQCSNKWDWKRLFNLLESGNRHGNAFWGICESGIYHFLHSKLANKDSSVKCKQVHQNNISQLQLAGACFSRLMFTGVAAKRSEKFKELFTQITSSLCDAILTALEVSDFPAATLQPLRDCQNLKINGLPRLVPLGRTEPDAKHSLQIAIARIDLLSSTLRTIFELGSSSELPLCLPLVFLVMSSTLSVNFCDARHASTEFIACVRRLLHCFSVIISSCGIAISPAAPPLITGLVYQLEWSSQYAETSPSENSLAFRLAIYRCLSAVLDVSLQTASATVIRLAPRIMSELCSDITKSVRISAAGPSLANANETRVLELYLCCTVAAFRIVEQLFVNHAFSFKSALSVSQFGNSRVDEDSSTYKLKKALIQLSSELVNIASQLISLSSQMGMLNCQQRLLFKPHLLVPFLNALSAMRDYGFLTSGCGTLRDFVRMHLQHDDPVVRSCAERNFRYSFRPLDQCPVMITEEASQPEVRPIFSVASIQTDLQPTTDLLTTAAIEEAAPVEAEGKQEHQSPASPEAAAPAPESVVPTKKRVHFEDAPTPTKRSCTEAPPNLPQQCTPRPPPPPPKASNREKNSEEKETPLSITDALCTFDDTLI